jgi:hypothetical protein
LQSDPSLPLAAARDAAVSFHGIVQASDEAYGLVTLKVRGGALTAPAPPAPVGEQRRIRVIASDVSLTRETPGPSSILNVLPARVVSMKPVDSNEVVVVIALGADGAGARLLARLARKSWEASALRKGCCPRSGQAVALARAALGLSFPEATACRSVAIAHIVRPTWAYQALRARRRRRQWRDGSKTLETATTC